METLSWETSIILVSYGLIGISTTIVMNSWWKSYYWASTIAAAISAVIFTLFIILWDGSDRAEGEGIMIALFVYFFFVPLTFLTGAVFKVVRRMVSA